jgi:DNA processing protein
MNDELLKAALLLNRITNYTPKQKCTLMERYSTALNVLKEREEAERIFDKHFKINGTPLDVERGKIFAEKELAFYRKNSIEVIPLSNALYPPRLMEIYDPPTVLFTKGDLGLFRSECPIALVGSRKASNGSINLGYSVARDLARVDTVVISGLAAGIDFYAHKGVLDGDGKTIAVLGNGIDIVYPKENDDLYGRIGKEGLLVTEFPLGTPPFKRNFPMRNRIISGLARAVVVVEASSGSGALITAMYALEQGREVMAFPGRASSDSFSGNNRLIKEGAHLVENAADILSILGKELEVVYPGRNLALSPLEQDILRVIGDDLVGIEDIGRIIQGPVSRIASALMMLELKSAVVRYPGKIYSRVQKYGE